MSCPYPDGHDDYETNMESLLIGLDTLKDATRNFSDEYKLGQGGFGPVYKVLFSSLYLVYMALPVILLT